MSDLSIVYVSSVSDRGNYDFPLIFIEDDTPVPNAETHTVAAFEALHIPMPTRRESG